MNSAKLVQQKMENEFGLLKEYKNVVDKVSSILDRCKYNEDPIQNLAGLYFNVEKITLVQNDLFVSNVYY
jgi:nesprin-1